MSQPAISMSKPISQRKLPSQTMINPKQNASSITLPSGKELKTDSSKKLIQGSTSDLTQGAEHELKIQIEK